MRFKVARREGRVLNAQPEFDDLDTIVEHALNWERKLKGNKSSAFQTPE